MSSTILASGRRLLRVRTGPPVPSLRAGPEGLPQMPVRELHARTPLQIHSFQPASQRVSSHFWTECAPESDEECHASVIASSFSVRNSFAVSAHVGGPNIRCKTGRDEHRSGYPGTFLRARSKFLIREFFTANMTFDLQHHDNR